MTYIKKHIYVNVNVVVDIVYNRRVQCKSHDSNPYTCMSLKYTVYLRVMRCRETSLSDIDLNLRKKQQYLINHAVLLSSIS